MRWRDESGRKASASSYTHNTTALEETRDLLREVKLVISSRHTTLALSVGAERKNAAVLCEYTGVRPTAGLQQERESVRASE